MRLRVYAITMVNPNPSVAWNRACTRALWNFRKDMSAVDTRLFQNNPIHRVSCLQFLKVRKLKLFPAALRTYLLLPLLGSAGNMLTARYP